MNPVIPRSSEGEPVVFTADQPQYRPLPASVTLRAVNTEWQPTFNERKALSDGARILLSVLTFGQPLQPVLLAVEGVESETARPFDLATDEPA